MFADNNSGGNSMKPGSIQTAPFMVNLLMREKCEIPSEDRMTDTIARHVGPVKSCGYNDGMIGFKPGKNNPRVLPETIPPILLLMKCTEFRPYELGTTIRSQMWDCPDSEEILSACKYHIMVTDMHTLEMPDYADRADILMDFIEALVELFPTCEAILFRSSGKMFRREKFLDHDYARNTRFIHFAVNFRIFDIQGSDDMIVDSVGMGVLNLPDLQYHFREIYPDWIVNHAYDLLCAIYDKKIDWRQATAVDGLLPDGTASPRIKWECRHQQAFMSPDRNVIDICTKISEFDYRRHSDNFGYV